MSLIMVTSGQEDINTKPQSGEELVLNLNKCVKNARRQESFYLVN